MDIFIHN